MDWLESLENACENRYWDSYISPNKSKCSCGNIFDPTKEGGPASNNPWSDFVCNDCITKLMDEK